MQNEFEDQLKREMETFSLEPNAEVWQHVERRITKEKRRKRIFALWFISSLILLSFGVFFVNQRFSNPSYTTVSGSHKGEVSVRITIKPQPPLIRVLQADSSIAKTHNVRQPASTKATVVKRNGKEMQLAVAKDGANHLATKPLVSEQVQNNNSSINSGILVKQRLKISTKGSTQKAVQRRTIPSDRKDYLAKEKKTGNNILLLKQQFAEVSKQNGDLDTASSYLAATSKIDTVLSNFLQQIKPTELGDSINNKIASKQTTKKRSSKWKIGAMVAPGISDNLVFGQKATPAFAQNNVVSGAGVSLRASASQIRYIPAFAFSIGVFGERSISKKMAVSIGVNYQFNSTQSNVGGTIDSSFSVYDPLLDAQSSSSRYYLQGDENRFTNRYHFVQMPVNILYQVNGSKKFPINASMGITPALLVSANGLYRNSISGLMYAEKNQFSRFQLFTQGGLSFSINRNLQFGPLLQYQISNLNKASLQSRQHLFFVGAQAKIFLKN